MRRTILLLCAGLLLSGQGTTVVEITATDAQRLSALDKAARDLQAKVAAAQKTADAAWDALRAGRIAVAKKYGVALDREMASSITGFGGMATATSSIALSNELVCWGGFTADYRHIVKP